MARDPNLLSIGALSRASGVPAETLRTWERRYGFPAPERTESGHRRYAVATLERLQWVTRALGEGHRPAVVLPADTTTLKRLLGAETGGAAPDLANGDEAEVLLDRLLDHVERLEGRALDRELRRAWGVLGGMRFLEACAGPLLSAVGERWATGTLEVAHEHFCSERLRDFLVQQWRPLSDAATGALVVCATPPGERHVLGLQLAATALSLHDVRVIFLGADCPAKDVARAVQEHDAEAVVLSVSCALEQAVWAGFYATLRGLLKDHVEVVAGGRGAMALEADGLRRLASFEALVSWSQGV